MSVDLRETITAARRDGRQRDIRCPAHHDKRASLSVGRGDDGGVVLHCHAGCETEGVLAAAGLTWADLRERRNGDRGRLPQIVATYDYTDDHGTLLYQVCRFAPKDFRQRKPDGAGGWTWRIGQTRRVLFGLPELRGHKIVYVPEGEKDAVALRALGLVATTNAGGAGKWRDEYAHQLRAAGVESVVVLPDNDDPGQKHAADVARSCHGAGLKVKIVTLPDLPPKADVSAWLASGHTRDDLMVAVESTAVFHAAASDKPAGETAKDKPDKRKQGREVQLDDPEPWADPVGGGTLLNAIAATFSRYLVLPKQANVALALWVLHAYAFDAWFTSPFLAITSPAKRCGKTLLLIVLGALVPRRLFASNVTPAVLFRTIEKYRPVLLIDEADTFVRDNDELRGVLNSGHTRTTAVAIRAVGDDHDPRAF